MRMVIVAGMVLVAAAFAFGVAAAPKVETKVVNDFENDADKDMFADSTAETSISDAHATSGKHSLKVVWSANKALSAFDTLPADWSDYKTFKLDLFLDDDASFTLRLKDKAGKDYAIWQQNASKGANTITLDLGAASGTVDLKQISHFFMYLVDENAKPATGYVDNVRLEK